MEALYAVKVPVAPVVCVFKKDMEGLGKVNWWSRGELNPRPPVRHFRLYMLSLPQLS